MTAYYNEIDPYAAEWLRNLIAAGNIAPGDVDERDIRDVRPSELADYTQCHFFAGIGIWSLALRQAGWPDDRPVWTGSCPCQPFSAAGKRAGIADERHLWPHWHWLIAQCRPVKVFGEQVASKDGRAWIDTVQTDMENLGFAIWAIDACAAGFGAPHIRQRGYFFGTADDIEITSSGLGNTNDKRRRLSAGSGWKQNPKAGGNGEIGRLADDQGYYQQWQRKSEPIWKIADRGRCAIKWLDNLLRNGWREKGKDDNGCDVGKQLDTDVSLNRPYPLNGLWSDADWLFCRDEKWRPVEPGTFPLVDAGTIRNRVGQLRASGNAINLGQATEFIGAVMPQINEDAA